MKTKMILSTLFAAALAIAGCSDDRETTYAPAGQTIQLSVSEKSLSHEAQTFEVHVASTHEFEAYSQQAWMKVSPQSTTSHEADLTVSVEENADTASRTGTITINAGGSRQSITVTQAAAPRKDITGPEGYTLVWNDEFEGTSLTSDWTYELQGPGWVNNELQNYVSDGGVTDVSNGTLKINLLKDGNDIKSARIYAKRKTGWKYGYIEARIKLPKGKGTWPAFWMMPVNYKAWPADGEIDIMESVGYDPNVVVSTIHCNKYNNTGTPVESARRTVATAQDEFHVYALEWTASRMTFLVDGSPLLTYDNDGSGKDAWPFDEPFYVILNLAWGGSWGGQQGVDESALPATMEVDYVRVFQK